MVSSASLRRRSRRSAFVADCEATPPPPNLEPARFCGGLVADLNTQECATYLVIHVSVLLVTLMYKVSFSVDAEVLVIAGRVVPKLVVAIALVAR
jgi:hypothetical protein